MLQRGRLLYFIFLRKKQNFIIFEPKVRKLEQ